MYMKKQTIVLADEDQNTLSEMVKNFTEDNYEILATTSSGEELISLIKDREPDVVVMDIVLGGCDGFKVLESVKGTRSNIIVQSSLSMDGFINKAISSGAKYYCIKPFDVLTLKERKKNSK